MEIYMSIADRFMAAFKGSDFAHGQTEIGNKRRNGKRNYREAKALVADQLLSFLIPFSDLIVFSGNIEDIKLDKFLIFVLNSVGKGKYSVSSVSI